MVNLCLWIRWSVRVWIMAVKLSLSLSRVYPFLAHISPFLGSHLPSQREWRDNACDFDDGGECGLALELGGKGGDDAGAKRFMGGSYLIFE